MNELRVCEPRRIVFEIVGEEVDAVVRDDGHRIRFAHGECVHDDLVREMVDAVVDYVVQVVEIMCEFVLKDLESTALN